MTTLTPRPASKMVELGQVIRHHRELRGKDLRTAADMCACSISLFEDYETGRAVPDGNRWGKLTHMLNRALSNFRPLWQEALNEEATRRAAVTAPKTLTTKPFAGLKLVQPEPAPAPEPEPTPVPVEEAPKVFAFNVGQLPPGWRSSERVQEREDFARAMVRDNPAVTTAEIREAQRVKFGVATAAKRIYEVVQDEIKRMDKAMAKETRRITKENTKAMAAPKPERQLVAEAVEAATELLMESIPNLSSFTVTVSADGEVQVAYKTRKVVVQEDAGTITMGPRK